MKTNIYYSVQNGGDGSAYPRLFESAELAELDQDMMEEGWGENCSGSITIESDGPIKIIDEVTTIEDVIKDLQEDIDDDIKYDNGVMNYQSKGRVEKMTKLVEMQKKKQNPTLFDT